MPRIAHFILIDAPIARVFDFVADYRNLPRIQAHFKSVRLLTAQAHGTGAQLEAHGSFHGLPLTVQMRIVDYRPPHLFVSDSEGGVRSRSTWRFSEQPGAIPGAPPRVRADLAIDYQINLPGLSLFGGLVQGDLSAMTADSLRRLKRLVEAAPAPPSS